MINQKYLSMTIENGVWNKNNKAIHITIYKLHLTFYIN